MIIENKDGTFAARVLAFYKSLKINEKLPLGVEVLNPYQDNDAFNLCRKFYKKYYSDLNNRYIILGINPGRFGGGITGIPFTDPIKLENICGIPNTLPKKAELSADFIYAMILAYGGPEKFYSRFYFNSVSPLGFTFESKNLNYYDTPVLLKSLENFILQSLRKQIDFGINRDIAFCLGEGENFKYLKSLNDSEKFFSELIPLSHPRFVMQYKRKKVDAYILDYLKKLNISK
jgi:hypothetical protein